MAQLNFKTWMEAVQLVRGYQDSHNVSPLGKLGWWTVFSAKERDKTGQIGGGSMGYNFSQRPDHIVDLRDSHVKPVFEEAAQRLAKLGFPRMHSNVVIVNLDNIPNQITGSGLGGYAKDKKHGFTISRGHIEVNLVIHEHAHMIWFNLPKDRQEFFRKYYSEAISSKTIDPKDIWTHSKSSFDPSGLDKAIEDSWTGFQEELERLLGHQFKSFFNIQSALANENESRLIESAVLTRFGESCMAEAKEEIVMENSLRGGLKVVRPGMHVLVEKFEKYIIGLRSEGTDKYEYPNPLTYDRMHNLVTFKPELLHEKQLDKMKKMSKVGKDRPSRFFAPNNKKSEINQVFQAAAEDIASRFNFGGGRGRNGTTFSAKQLFPRPEFYQTWMSRIGRRFKAGKINDINGIKQVYIDAVKSKATGNLSNAPDNISSTDIRKKGYSGMDLQNKNGSNLRDLIYQQGIVPSPYAAANIDELWAVAVEYAAMDWKVSREMKKLIYSTITGTRM